MSLQDPLQNSLLTQLFWGHNFFLIWRFEPCSLKVNIFLLPSLVYVRLPDICIFTELQDESLLIHKGWMAIKNANVYKIIGMLCFNALWQVHRFVSQVYGWIVYKINKLAPKWKKKPICLSCGQFIVMLRGDFGINLFYMLALHYYFPPSNIKPSSHNSFSKGEDEKIDICLSQILEHRFTTKWTSFGELPLLCLHLVITGRLASSGF